MVGFDAVLRNGVLSVLVQFYCALLASALKTFPSLYPCPRLALYLIPFSLAICRMILKSFLSAVFFSSSVSSATC